MVKLSQRNNTFAKEKSQLDVKIEALLNEKHRLVEELKQKSTDGGNSAELTKLNEVKTKKKTKTEIK